MMAFVFKNWWVVCFFLLSFFLYDQGMRQKNAQQKSLEKKRSELVAQKEQAQALQETLLSELNSQEDPAWIEMVLKKRLGLVPEGEKKVVFTQ